MEVCFRLSPKPLFYSNTERKLWPSVFVLGLDSPDGLN